jgi:hypothetical protein
LTLSDSGTSNGTGGTPRAGVAIAAAALAVLMLGGGVLVAVSATDDDPWGSYAEGWTALPAAPSTAFLRYVWTGSSVIAWDGGLHRSQAGANTAFTFAPGSKTWTPTSPAPMAGFLSAAIWTGSEVLYFAGDHTGMQVVGFDPARDAWDPLPASPAGPNALSSFMWTGRDVVVFGGMNASHGVDPGTDQAGAFDTETDTWSTLPSALVAMSAPVAAWSGHELIVAGWSSDLLHPTTDALQTLSFDPATSTWHTLPDSGLASTETGFSWDCGHPAVFSATTSTWTGVDPPMTMGTSIVPYGFTVAAEDGFLVNAIVPTLQGAPVREHTAYLWFWKPPAQ